MILMKSCTHSGMNTSQNKKDNSLVLLIEQCQTWAVKSNLSSKAENACLHSKSNSMIK